MAQTSDLDRVTAIVLRFMRGPILLLIIVYGVGITGLALIPGQDANGNPAHMGIFHAFYFMSYTATTTGFGEIPNDFTDVQRMWAIVCLYMSVIGWIYAIGSIISLVQNPHFKQALFQKRFALTVKNINEPFVIVAGFGDTGSLLARGLSDRYIRGVIIDGDIERIKALGLRDYRVKMPGLEGDPCVPKTLLDAGLRHPRCHAVVALTSDEEANLKIAVLARLLNPSVQIICRSTSRAHEEELRSMVKVAVVDPFETFAKGLCTAILSPKLHTLDEWLIGARGAQLSPPLHCPMGTWILCGYGRMGKHVHASLHDRGIPSAVIDPNIKDVDLIEHKIIGFANRKNLIKAGVETAAGIVVATKNDSTNLKILLTIRTLNPNIFIVARQNYHENEVAFLAARADLTMQPSLVTARKILHRLISPLIQSFLDHLQSEAASLEQVYRLLDKTIADSKPYLWSVDIPKDGPCAASYEPGDNSSLMLGDLIRHPSDRGRNLDCIALVIRRNGVELFTPRPSQTRVLAEDVILFCGTKGAQRLLEATMNNPYTLHYLTTGTQEPAGVLMKWIYQYGNNKRT
ncbi:MAG: potassium transporter [Gammaproteobacteria bacterium]|nr:potassium transporter [Gammaproteobacteria bacterium]